ncbi:YihY/virulence factor BrkB family protein [Roseovarius sp. SCSIO 43702]|uniref:YihY/virulence factor BrkB family protein n=1 Tax=Roseovarius sp. SCSIO 43702 TaxID=2823043 RepID=UPI001C737D7F|nr:YihY/virulence factor BrkB family protein [Roseovarius sp. SCSIO 43702]QYX57797.1 YihY/virulence factor BrkB family protein [Roseovarius sp. SCSIO 43702]
MDRKYVVTPTEFGPRVWWRVLVRVVVEIDNRNLGLIAAGVAFYALLSLFPAIAALVAIWGFAGDPDVLLAQFDMVRQFLPEEALLLIQDQVNQLIIADNTTLQWASILSIAVSVWSAKNATAAMIRGLNSVYRETNRRNTVMRYVASIGLTLLMLFAAIVAVGLVIALPVAMALLNLPFKVELLVTGLKWIVLLAVMFFCIGLLYRFGPNRRGAVVSWLTPGAVFALLTWLAGSVAFSMYLRNFGSFNEVYGSLGALVALLFWLYISAFVVLIGAQINAELELQTAEDTTVGAQRPPGQRRAYVADNILDDSGEVRLADPTDVLDAQPSAKEDDDKSGATPDERPARPNTNPEMAG